MSKDYSLTWDLENIYAGGSGSEELQQTLQEVKADLDSFVVNVSGGMFLKMWKPLQNFTTSEPKRRYL